VISGIYKAIQALRSFLKHMAPRGSADHQSGFGPFRIVFDVTEATLLQKPGLQLSLEDGRAAQLIWNPFRWG